MVVVSISYCCVVTVITLFFFHCDFHAECPLVHVALGSALGGKFVPPKDSGYGCLQHVLLSCAVTVLTLFGWRCNCPHASLVLASMLQLAVSDEPLKGILYL